MRYISWLIIVSIYLISSSADVWISNDYYTTGSDVSDDVFLHKVDYNDKIEITGAGISLAGDGSNSSGSLDSAFRNIINSNNGQLGVDLGISAEELSFSKGLAAGLFCSDSGDFQNNDAIKFNYALDTGAEHAAFFNQYTKVEETLKAVNCTYSAELGVDPEKVYLDGYGSRFSYDDEDSGFDYNLRLCHMGLWADTSAYLKAIRIDDTEATPVVYQWKVNVSSDSSKLAESGFNMTFVAGDRQIEAMITGSDSTGFMTTLPLDKPIGTPWIIDPWLPAPNIPPAQTIEELLQAVDKGMINSAYINFILEPGSLISNEGD